MSSKMGLRLAIALIILVIFIIIGIMLLVVMPKQYSSPAVIENQVEDAVDNDNDNNTEGIEEDLDDKSVDTSDWQTYRSEDFGFSFDYPQDWFLKDHYLGPEEVVYLEICGTNASILFGIFYEDHTLYQDGILDSGNINYQIENSERNLPDSEVVIHGKIFKKYDLKDYGRYEGTSAGNIIIVVGPDMDIEGNIINLIFEWQELSRLKNSNNKKEIFEKIISTVKID